MTEPALEGTHCNSQKVKRGFIANSLAPPLPDKPQVARKPFPSSQNPSLQSPLYSCHRPKPRAHPPKPSIAAVSMEKRFRPPAPVGMLPGPVPLANKPAVTSVAALKEALEKGGQDEVKVPRPSLSLTPKPPVGKILPDGDKQPKFTSTLSPKPPPIWKKPPTGLNESEPSIEAPTQSPFNNEVGHANNKTNPIQITPGLLHKKPLLDRQNNSEPLKFAFNQNSAHSNTSPTHNAAGQFPFQKKLLREVSNPKILGHTALSTTHNETDPSQPKQKPLPSMVSLGMCPAKPRRPPYIDLQIFCQGFPGFSSDNGFPPPPPPDVPEVRPLPLREVEEESYDDVNIAQSKTGQNSEFEDEFNNDSETYDDIDNKWPDVENEKSNEIKDTNKTKNKDSKKLKKKMEKEKAEREKKEKKEMEKREQEARKKFKLKGSVEVLLKGTVRVDCKGSKTDLELERGEKVEIVRTTANPAGLWLARNSRGYYGYVKSDVVDTEGNGQEPITLDVYDDVGASEQSSSLNKVPEIEEGDDIYDCVEDGTSDTFFPPPPPAIDEETYDEAISTGVPSVPQVKTDEMDPKKKKRFEKEEKEFRKKFKYDQEIRVLFVTNVLPVLVCKKFGNKDLVVKPGDAISVISSPKDGKVIGRNSDGKFGYVSVSNIEQDSDIYDDVGEDCVYDND
ncbi:FYN-binding protein 1-like [Hoplias malabaricus]|uniref:FYN-binding protein 1-like n=1 Tax=Hoplias malabaricus TaxID=27720 RepID=UPI003462B709